MLNWKTATEQNSAYYEVERRNAKGDYEKIGEQSAKGFASSISSYQFMDPAPVPGTNYYRLNQVDLDGQSGYSEVVAVDYPWAGMDVEVTPNPVDRDGFRLSVRSAESGTLQFRLVDLHGQVLLQDQQNIRAGLSQEYWALDGLAPGIYLLQTEFQGQTSSLKVVKL